VTNGDDLNQDDTESLLRSYFALSHSLSSLYEQWASSDANFARRAPAFTGIRILNQDAWEALVAFICSSNNNISRISQMVQKLCVHYGPYIATIEGEPFHDFPGPEALSGVQVETHLRQLGFGYRAKYIAQTAEIIASPGRPGWLLGLRNPESPAFGVPTLKAEQTGGKSDGEAPASYRAAHEALLTLPGVGPKVADCVCLMGLGWGEAVPVDTRTSNAHVTPLFRALYAICLLPELLFPFFFFFSMLYCCHPRFVTP
jgi:N-glycosylase/DNA lyase